jgi:hypothetical protein
MMTGVVKFRPEEHEGHAVHGAEVARYTGTLHVVNGDWWLGNNSSDDGSLDWIVEGCYDCDVKFLSEGE